MTLHLRGSEHASCPLLMPASNCFSSSCPQVSPSTFSTCCPNTQKRTCPQSFFSRLYNIGICTVFNNKIIIFQII
uniref:Uncharacterized protein n=1 Tax=Anguilla anguilla TaxID=7936 RepID=A0A0E9TZB2_ANGAN